MGPVHPDQHKIDDRINAAAQGYSDEDGIKVVAGRIGVPRANVAGFAHDPENPTHLNLGRFAEWRRTKCIPRNYEAKTEHHADLSQATHELCGEAGEVAELILKIDDTNPEARLHPELRTKMIDEIGDILFCASWAGDAWQANPLVVWPQLGFRLANTIVDKPDRSHATLMRLGLLLNCQAGLLANSAKKVLCQGREQDTNVQHRRIMQIFELCAMILSMFNADISLAAARNIEKLDHRFPDGHPLLGGGIRTGKGA